MNSTHLYACGSYAYNPHDAFLVSYRFIVQRFLAGPQLFGHKSDCLCRTVAETKPIIVSQRCEEVPSLCLYSRLLQDTESFSIIQHGSAKGRCPFSPLQRNTALVIGQSPLCSTQVYS